jgi:hypothetical protein
MNVHEGREDLKKKEEEINHLTWMDAPIKQVSVICI